MISRQGLANIHSLVQNLDGKISVIDSFSTRMNELFIVFISF